MFLAACTDAIDNVIVTWDEKAPILPTVPDGIATYTLGVQCGGAVAVTDRWLVSGCMTEELYVGFEGAVSVYAKDTASGDWVEHSLLTPPDEDLTGNNMKYGYSVAVHGDTIAIGAPNQTVWATYNSGSVFIYTLDQDTD
eukprot:g7298.t1